MVQLKILDHNRLVTLMKNIVLIMDFNLTSVPVCIKKTIHMSKLGEKWITKMIL